MIGLYLRRRIVNAANLSLAVLLTLFALFWLAWILWTLLRLGGRYLDLAVFTQSTPGPGEPGGLANALVGSAIITLLGVLIGAPIGVLAGTYLAEFDRRSRFAATLRFLNDVLLSAPSIVLGVFIYAIAVATVRHFSAWAGALALALIVIPIVLRTTESMLLLVPDTLRESAAALGAPRWKIVTAIAYRAARGGIATGVLLAVARIAGETAPLLFTALNNQFWSLDVNAPMANLPVTIFNYAMGPYDEWHHLAWAGALLVTAAILAISLLSRLLLRRKHNG